MKYILILNVLMLSAFKWTVKAEDIDNEIEKYFNDANTKEFGKVWDSYKHSFNAEIEKNIGETIGDRDMNLIINDDPKDLHWLVKGLLVAEETVSVLFINMTLRSIPKIKMSVVDLSLEDNMFQLRAAVDRMYIDAKYFRLLNDSKHDIKPPLEENLNILEKHYTSPFVRPDVATSGNVAITADCNLKGNILATMSGRSINLGANDLAVTDCSFEVEIYTDHSNAPTVISNYFVNEAGEELGVVLSQELSKHLLPRLQSIVYSVLNTSTVFGPKLSKYRKPQMELNSLVIAENSRTVSAMDKLIVDNDESTITMEPFEVVWLPQYGNYNFSFHGIQLSGLDSAYSSHSGGAKRIKRSGFTEEIKYHLLQLTGQFTYVSKLQVRSSDAVKLEAIDIVCEIVDLGAQIQLYVGSKKPVIRVRSWRDMSYGIKSGGIVDVSDRDIPHSFVHAFALKNVREAVKEHLDKYYMKAAYPNSNSKVTIPEDWYRSK